MEINLNKCNICGKTNNLVDNLFVKEKIGLRICNICIEKLHKISEKYKKKGNVKVSGPREIHEKIRKILIGQDDALKDMTVAIFKFIIQQTNPYLDLKSNVMIIGPTGSGKTHCIKTIATLFDIPVLIVDISVYTASGYIGEEVTEIFVKLLKKVNGNIKKAENSIIFMDEFDKISSSRHLDKDIGGLGVQNELLTMLEGNIIDVQMSDSKRRTGISLNLWGKTNVTLNTKNIMFVAAGVFQGLTDKIKLNQGVSKNSLLTTPKSKDDYKDLIRTSLIDHGIISELTGRFQIVTLMKNLSKTDLLSILKLENGRLSMYIDLFMSYDINVEVEESVCELICEYSYNLKLGVRGITYYVDKLFTNILFDIDYYKKNKIKKINLSINDFKEAISDKDKLLHIDE